MNEIRLGQRLRELFPHGSKAFFQANTDPDPDVGLRAPEREPDSGPALVSETPGEEKSDARPSVCISMFRVRKLDPDNAYGAAKCLIDCLCQVALIPGDSEKEIDLEVLQQKVGHRHEQRTEVKIVYP